jgi:hypothetical protein
VTGDRAADDRDADQDVTLVGDPDAVLVAHRRAVVSVPIGDELAGLGEGDRHGA